jgi:hypothetical protein
MRIAYIVTFVLSLIGVPSLHAQDAGPSGVGATLTPLDAATVEDASRSISAATQARITFVNRSDTAVDIYWITYEGKRMLYRAGLVAGATWQVHTFLTHPWLVVASGTGGSTARDSGVRLAGFEALTPNGDTAFIAGVPGLRVQEAPPPPKGVALAPLDAATVDDALRSSNGATRARITFVNQSRGAVDVYWIAYDGTRVLYRANLAVGDSWEVNTFLTHPWLVVASGTGGSTARDSGDRLAGFEALTSDGDTAVIKNPE